MKSGKVFICALIVFFLAMPSQLPAQEGKISIGNLKIIPGIEGQAIYDDNIYMKNGSNTTTQKKVSDWIYHVKPALLLNYTIPERGFVNLGYQGDWALYNVNDKNNWKTNKGSFATDYKAPGGLMLGISNLYSASEDPYGSPDQYGVGRVTSRWDNDLKSKLGFLFTEKFRTFLYYNYYKQDYKDQADASQNYYDSEFGLGAEAKFLPKTWGFIRYYYGKRDFDAASVTSAYKANSNWHKTNVGLTWDAAAKLSGELNVGYQWKSYDNEYYAATLKRNKNVDTWVASTTISYKPIETTNLLLNIARTLRDTGADTGEYFEDTGFGLSLQQTVLRKFVFNLGGMYSTNDYNTHGRRDTNVTANLGVDYKIKDWVTFGVGYNFRNKNSNFKDNEYTDNQFLTSLKIVY
ncbi:MAG: outer membrane beta-barrel protein [Pseudomonadota bacterium]